MSDNNIRKSFAENGVVVHVAWKSGHFQEKRFTWLRLSLQSSEQAMRTSTRVEGTIRPGNMRSSFVRQRFQAKRLPVRFIQSMTNE